VRQGRGGVSAEAALLGFPAAAAAAATERFGAPAPLQAWRRFGTPHAADLRPRLSVSARGTLALQNVSTAPISSTALAPSAAGASTNVATRWLTPALRGQLESPKVAAALSVASVPIAAAFCTQRRPRDVSHSTAVNSFVESVAALVAKVVAATIAAVFATMVASVVAFAVLAAAVTSVLAPVVPVGACTPAATAARVAVRAIAWSFAATASGIAVFRSICWCRLNSARRVRTRGRRQPMLDG